MTRQSRAKWLPIWNFTSHNPPSFIITDNCAFITLPITVYTAPFKRYFVKCKKDQQAYIQMRKQGAKSSGHSTQDVHGGDVSTHAHSAVSLSSCIPSALLSCCAAVPVGNETWRWRIARSWSPPPSPQRSAGSSCGGKVTVVIVVQTNPKSSIILPPLFPSISRLRFVVKAQLS